MAFIDWINLDLHTGDAIIDQQHERIFELVNEAYNLFLDIKDNSSMFEFTTCIMAIKEYLDYHFEEEEKIMHALDYPYMAEHIEKHNEVRYDVHLLADKLIDEKNPNIKFLSKKLLLVLRDLLVEHLSNEDKVFVRQCALMLREKIAK